MPPALDVSDSFLTGSAPESFNTQTATQQEIRLIPPFIG